MRRRIIRRCLRIITVLGIIGVCLSIESYREFARSMMGESTWCSFGELSSCEKAFESDYSVLFGRPISFYGMAAYFLVACISLVGLLNGGPYLLSSLFHMAFMSMALVAATLYFAWALFFQVQTICILCVSDYIVNLSIAGVTLYGWRCLKPPWKALLKWDLESIFGTRKGFAQAVVMLALMAILGALVVRFEHWYYLFTRGFDKVLANEVERIQTPWTRAFPSIGPEDAPIQIVSFGDYECPFCDVQKKVWNGIMEDYPGLIRMTAVEHPLNSDCNPLSMTNKGHPYACRAAYLALAVHAKAGNEKFWEIHDELYKNGQSLSDEFLKELAARYGLAPEDIDKAYTDSLSPRGIENHIRISIILAFPGLPMTVMNGIKIQGYVEDWAMRKMIESELALKGLKLKDFRKK